MRVHKTYGLQVRVTAKVVRRSVIYSNAGGKTDTTQLKSVLLLRLTKIDGKKVGDVRSYIPYTKQIARLKLLERDIIEFTGYARNGAEGYHFVRLSDIQVNRKEDDPEDQWVWGVLPDGVSLTDYVEYVVPQKKKKRS